MNSLRNVWIAVVVVAIIAIVGLISPKAGIVQIPELGGGTRMINGLSTTSTSPDAGEVQTTYLTTGSSGTKVDQLITGTCSLLLTGGTNVTIAATTTKIADCAVSGVVTGDVVFAQFATSTAVNGGWTITSAAASTTSGYITVGVQNNTGASAVIPASVASTTRYLILSQ